MIRNKPHINPRILINFLAWLKHINHTQSTSGENTTFPKYHIIIIIIVIFLSRSWVNCYYFFILQNGTWYHLSVHAAPNFVVVPKDIVYVGIGDNIILNCQVKSITEVFAEKTNYSKLTAKLFKLPFELFYNFAVFLLLCCYNSFIVIKQSY